MKRPTAGSFLVRVESERGALEGVVTSVSTGDRESFSDLSEMTRIIARWCEGDEPDRAAEEERP